MHPDFASSEYTDPSAAPTKTLPSTTEATPNAVVTPTNPNAHFSFNFGVVCRVSPACRAGWNRVLAGSAQPFQLPVPEARCGAAEHLADGGIGFESVVPRDFAMASRSVALRLSPTGFIFPVSSAPRSEEHTSELQSHSDLVCRLLLEKKK